MGTSPQFRKEITRRTTILSAALKTFAGKQPPLPPLVGKFTQSIDCALPGKHTRLLYDSLSKPQAALLTQLRTGKSRLNDYLAKINAVESDLLELRVMPWLKPWLKHRRVWPVRSCT